MWRRFLKKVLSYSRLKCSEKSHPSHSIFSVSHLGLPQNMRSLFLASERYAMEYPLLRPSPPQSTHRFSSLRSLSKLIIVSIVSCMAVVTMTMVAILLVLSFQMSSSLNISSYDDNNLMVPLPDTETRNTNFGDIHRHSASNIIKTFSSSIRCHNKCWPYTAFRFQSECRNGVCQCRAKGYNSISCLPVYKDCTIRRNSSNSVAYWHKRSQTTFGCHSDKWTSPQTNGRVHVVSTMNEWKAQLPIILNVTAETNKKTVRPITLVLASYYPAHWFIQMQTGIHIKSILQVSTVQIYSGRISLNGKDIAEHSSLLTKQRSLVGYGDDRYSGHTLQLFQTVDKHLGPITSFSGAQRANFWMLDIS